MQAIIDFLSGIGEGIQTAIAYLGGLIGDLVEMATMLAEGVAALPSWFGMFFPEQIVVAIMGIFAVVVIYKIIGREG